jgi:hypothetical protein
MVTVNNFIEAMSIIQHVADEEAATFAGLDVAMCNSIAAMIVAQYSEDWDLDGISMSLGITLGIVAQRLSESDSMLDEVEE